MESGLVNDRRPSYLSQHQGWSLIADRYITSCLQLLCLRVAVRDRQHSFHRAVNDRLHMFLGRAVNDRQLSLILLAAFISQSGGP